MWVGLGVIADTLLNIGRYLARLLMSQADRDAMTT